MFNVVLHVEYNGSVYRGFQRQKDLSTVQACLEQALSQVADHPVSIHCAGRTDAGVHATAQVISFKTPAERPLRAWSLGVNQYLPPDIAIRKALFMPEDFHARFSAISRSYRYVINNHSLRHAIWNGLATHYPISLDEKLMQQGANFLIGEQDFSAFRGGDCQAHSPIREIQMCQITRENHWVYLDITANGFLHHMVRNIVGSLIEVGRAERQPEWINELLKGRSRTAAGVMLAPQGLYLVGVSYSDPYNEANSFIIPSL